MNCRVFKYLVGAGTCALTVLLAAGHAQADDSEGPAIRVSGIIKPEMVYANGLRTFGRQIFVAPTEAGLPTDIRVDDFRQSFQLQQSRFSLHVGEGSAAEGHVEIDFVDPGFNRSSPIQGTAPRLRLAYLKLKPAAGHTILVGQQWDIFSPLNPTMMNMVGVSYRSGNSAFLRPQVIYNYTGGPWEVAGSIGMQRQNPGVNPDLGLPQFNGVEFALLPAVSLRVSHRVGKTWYGVSAIGSNQVSVVDPEETAATYAVNAFAKLALSPGFGLSIEGYYGKNTGALGLLTLANGTEVTDAGGFVSANISLDEKNALWLVGSGAVVLNKEELGLNAIESNIQARATYVHKPMKGVEIYAEPFLFLTNYNLEDESESSRTGFGTALGSRYRF